MHVEERTSLHLRAFHTKNFPLEVDAAQFSKTPNKCLKKKKNLFLSMLTVIFKLLSPIKAFYLMPYRSSRCTCSDVWYLISDWLQWTSSFGFLLLLMCFVFLPHNAACTTLDSQSQEWHTLCCFTSLIQTIESEFRSSSDCVKLKQVQRTDGAWRYFSRHKMRQSTTAGRPASEKFAHLTNISQ